MSTNPEQPQAAPAPDNQFDELTGVYGFFRKHQKLLLYTAGLFTLLTFSITGPLLGFFDSLTRADRDRLSIVVNGDRVKLTSEDFVVGEQLARSDQGNLPPGVMPAIQRSDRSDNYKHEDYAILRRAAITEGFGYSLTEVDEAIEAFRELNQIESPAKLAQRLGFSSLAEYRGLVAEAMRVGTYMQLQLLALPTGDAAVVKQLLADREKCTYEAAWFDEKAEIERRKTETPMTDEDLHEWFDGKDEREKTRYNAYDLPIAQLAFDALLFEEGQFDPSQWQDGPLKDFAINEAQLQTYYDSMRDLLFQDENGDYQAFDDEGVQATLTRVVQAERVMNDLLGRLKEKQKTSLEALTTAVTAARNAHVESQRDERAATQTRDQVQKELTTKRDELAAKPDDEDLKAAVAELETRQEAAVTAFTEATNAQMTKAEELEAAQKAESDARQAFDLSAELQAMVEGKSGFVHKEMAEKKNADAIEDLDELGLGLGEWPNATEGTNLQNAGDLCNNPARTSKAVMLFQVMAVEPKPLKAWDDLKPLVEDAYWSETVSKEAREKRDAFADLLLAKAKEHMTEFLANIEGERQSRIDTMVQEWEQGVTDAIAEAEQMLSNDKLGNKARTAWQRTLDAKKRELEAKDRRVEGFTRRVESEIEREIRDESKKHYDKVLAAAAQEAGFTHAVLGPYPRDLEMRPRFRDRYDATVVYLWSTQNELEQGEATEILFDSAGRRHTVALCTKVEPMTLGDLTRREFRMAHGEGLQFAAIQAQVAMLHAFSHEALLARYQAEQVVGTQEVEAAGGN